jgi:hypothetical protein
LGNVLEQEITLEKCVECGKVYDPWLDMWLQGDSFNKEIHYVEGYCNRHQQEYYNNPGTTSSKSEANKP